MTEQLEDGMILTAERLISAIDDRATRIVEDALGGEGTSAAGPPKVYLASQTPQGGFSWWTTDTSDNRTLGEIRSLQGKAGWVRVILMYDRVESCSVVGMKLAQSSLANVPIAPVDIDGAPVAWVDVTFNSGGLPRSLAEQLQADIDSIDPPVTTIALNGPPANATAWADTPNHKKQPGYTFSDWMHVPPQRRANASDPALLCALIRYSGTVAMFRAVGASVDSLLGGRLFRSYEVVGDALTDPTDFNATVRTTNRIAMILQYVPHRPVVQIMHTGDSTENPLTNHVAQAAYTLSSAATPIEYCSTTAGGLSAAEFMQKLRPVIANADTSIVFLRVWSPNAGTSLSQSEQGWAEAMQTAQFVAASGGIPVLMTPYPNPGRITTAEGEAIRLEMVRRVREAEVAGAHVLDLDLLMSDNASPVAGLQPGYSDDGTHPTDDGQTLISQQATQPLLASLLGL